jgi:3-oxoacyl-[acyl-carrier-protein] synthase-1
MIHSYLENCNIISPLGWDTRENLLAVLSGKQGIQNYKSGSLSPVDLPLALLDWTALEKRFLDLAGPDKKRQFTRFEKMGILSISDALRTSMVDPGNPDTAFILSTTKGNVELLDQSADYGLDRLYLWKSAEVIADFFGVKSKPVIVSNACVSGVSAMLVGRQMIGSGKYKHVIVLGADLVSRFIVSGFQSFLSLSAQPCRPFDSERDGLTLGEAAATLILSSNPGEVELVAGSTSNDANHISGPSRSGEGLLLAIRSTLKDRAKPGVISAHGTATLYNDEMESIALSRAGLEGVAVNSLKAYFGHTLGAAGLVESIINIECLKQGQLPATKGFSKLGVSGEINVSDQFGQGEKESFLKIASGFGGCNAAALFILR